MGKHAGLGRKIGITLAATTGVLLLAAAAYGSTHPVDQEPSGPYRTAVYLPLTEEFSPNLSIMKDLEDGAIFELSEFPQDIRDIDGTPITQRDLKTGDTLKIYFQHGAVSTLAVPACYGGAVQVRVLEKGNPEQAGQYQDIIDAFYNPHPEDRPWMHVEYADGSGAIANDGGYRWTFSDGETEIRERPPILQQDGFAEMATARRSDLYLLFAQNPDEVTVVRWPENLRGADPIPAGEPVETELREGRFVIPKAEPNYIYQVDAVSSSGEMTFGFWT